MARRGIPPSSGREFASYLFLAPALTILFLFFLLPAAISLVLSLTDFDIYALADYRYLRWIGGRNYQELMASSIFWKALRNTLFFVVVAGPATLLVSLCVALLLTSKSIRGGGLFRTIFFAPVVTTIVAVAVVWRYLCHTEYGLINHGLAAIGIARIDWLGDPSWSLPAIILLCIWKNFGYTMVIFIAGLQNVRVELYEAAELDGASYLQRLRNITLPALVTHAHLCGCHNPHRIPAAVCRTVRDDPRRSAAQHVQSGHVDVRAGLPLVEPGLCGGRGFCVVSAGLSDGHASPGDGIPEPRHEANGSSSRRST